MSYFTSEEEHSEDDFVHAIEDRVIQPAGSFDSYQQIASMDRCLICGRKPCVFLQYQDTLIEMYEVILEQFPVDSRMTNDEKNKIFRHSAYTSANTWLGGPHGKHNRAPLPECMQDGIRSIAPSTSGYKNYREAPL